MKKVILYLAAIALAVSAFVSSTPRAAQSAAGNAGFELGSRVQLQANTNELRIAVTPKGYDDIGSILSSMGWKFTEIMPSDLRNYDLLAQFDVIFINCSSDNSTYSSDLGPEGDPTIANLERFVREGGTLYASDHAFVYIDEAFPGYLQYHNDPDFPYETPTGEQSVIADIRDSGLASFMNSPTVEIRFDLPEWVPIQSVSDGVTVYLAGDFTRGDGTRVNDKPLAASFAYGKGRVVYTAYHNEAQTTEEEKKLLAYLVFVTTTGKLSAALQESMTASGHDTQVELLGAISAGATSPRYTFVNQSIIDLAVGLNWQEGTLRLSVFKPDGSLSAQQEGPPPLIIVSPNAEAGAWSYQVDAIDVPYDNYPYVVQLSVPAIVVAAPSATPEKPVGIVQATPSATPDNPADTASAPGKKSTTIYIIVGGILCLVLVFAVVLIGVVVFFAKRRRA